MVKHKKISIMTMIKSVFLSSHLFCKSAALKKTVKCLTRGRRYLGSLFWVSDIHINTLHNTYMSAGQSRMKGVLLLLDMYSKHSWESIS